jgi:hypothetical protein
MAEMVPDPRCSGRAVEADVDGRVDRAGELPVAGLRRTAGAGQNDGRDTVARIRALPVAENGTGAVAAATVPPQYTDAARSGTGLAPVVVSTRPFTSTVSWPPLPSRTWPRASCQGAPPGATPTMDGSVGTLGRARRAAPRRAFPGGRSGPDGSRRQRLSRGSRPSRAPRPRHRWMTQAGNVAWLASYYAVAAEFTRGDVGERPVIAAIGGLPAGEQNPRVPRGRVAARPASGQTASRCL